MKKIMIIILLIILIGCIKSRKEYSYQDKVILLEKVIVGDLRAVKEYEKIMMELSKNINVNDQNAIKEMEEWIKAINEILGISIITTFE
ncbi:hypothetical protein [Fusobacterium ulcerans]|uniref:hypothetical protein n=1 Tax=Fusobacterium ulcerans TaxID=861 RepID=UPI00309AC5C2